MLKRVHAPHLNRDVVFGRKRPVASGLRMKLGDYLKKSVPAPPSLADYSPAANTILADIMGNDQLGDCVIAGGYHLVGVATGNAGDPFHATHAEVIKDYGAIGGYVPGDPSTDQGCDEQTALNYWMQKGFANGTRLLGWLAVDATNKEEVQQAIYLFENVIFGVELPDAWITPFPSGDGFTWGKAGAPDPQNGHCFIAFGYDSIGAKIDTWGMKGTVTYEAIAEYASKSGNGELYVALTPDMLSKGQTKAPNGVDWSYLIADFDALGGNVPAPPAPAPVPVPPPAPAPPPPAPVPAPPAPVPVPPAPTPVVNLTLAQVQAWAIASLKAGHTVITKEQAERAVLSSLAKHWPKGQP